MDNYLSDSFSRATRSLSDPSSQAAAVTPSDATVLTATKALYVGVTGDVCVDLLDGGTSIVFKAVPAGAFLPIRAVKVKATSTTATSIVALF